MRKKFNKQITHTNATLGDRFSHTMIANHILDVEPLRLKVEPQRLKVEPQRLKVEPQRLKVEPLRLKVEPQRLKVEPQRLKVEPQRLKVEPLRLTVEPPRLTVKPPRLTVEPPRLSFADQKSIFPVNFSLYRFLINMLLILRCRDVACNVSTLFIRRNFMENWYYLLLLSACLLQTYLLQTSQAAFASSLGRFVKMG
ncbi:hypothetical protein [Anabaena azotica]|uniref:Zonadhesin n=1 Tax=Anabaena azotica FACHB-119 TaxID=947527 RepID=A0ABR8CYI8_9NOST|nr:hypothetical protein [Anabaena azotica]MBD2499040.1 hypothetical protein [Anabaena azotica FACHB-119]